MSNLAEQIPDQWFNEFQDQLKVITNHTLAEIFTAGRYEFGVEDHSEVVDILAKEAGQSREEAEKDILNVAIKKAQIQLFKVKYSHIVEQLPKDSEGEPVFSEALLARINQPVEIEPTQDVKTEDK